MGFYFRKSVSVGPLRFNLSGSGIGVSAGVPGLRVGTGPRGNYVHVGRGGLYYRTSLGSSAPAPAAPSAALVPAAPVHPATTVDGLPEIESGSVLAMAPASSAELLEEIRTKQRRVRLWPFVGILGVAGLLAVAPVAPKWGTLAGLVLLIAATTWVRWRDAVRKTVALLYDLDGPIVEAYQGLHDGFDWLVQCGGSWHFEARGSADDRKRQAGASHLVKRRAVRLRKGDPPGMRVNVEVPLLPVGRQTLYLLPDRVLVVEGAVVGAVEYRDLQVEVVAAKFIEEEGVPADAEVVGSTWRYVNKSGGPDRRFKDNPEIPIVLYGELRLSSTSGLNEVLQVSRKDAPGYFAAGVTGLARALAGSATAPA
jgi:hypothetical protein